jgi:hypothetical protein
MDANGAAAGNNNHHHDAGGVVLTTLQRSFKHSLKQALFLQHGNSRISLNLTKQSYERIWESILAANYSWYRQVNSNELQVMSNSNNNNSNNSNSNVSISNVHMLPIRLFVDSQPPQQRPCRPIKGTSCASAASTRQVKEIVLISTKTVWCVFPTDDNTLMTLGDLLLDWAPQWFTTLQTTKGHNDDEVVAASSSATTPTLVESTIIEPTLPYISWWIGGIQPPLTCSLLELWKHLCHPDHMLYIILITRPS